ncbi:MAG: leucine-rich repeat domain-containing protein [Pseudomonadota bacterium]|nr:leucine-rich repeat domain-containing protein [Pseudomonadota bacterium]
MKLTRSMVNTWIDDHPGATCFECPQDITSIEGFAFIDSVFESVILPDSLESIATFSFTFKKGPKSLILPRCVTSVGYFAFYMAPFESLQLTVGSNGINATLLDNIFRGFPNIIPFEHLKSIDISGDIEHLDDNMFCDFEELKEVKLPSGLKSIGSFAFKNCKSLKSLKLPSGLKRIGAQAFQSCVSLESVYLPESLEDMGQSMFLFADNLRSIRIPDGIKKINDWMLGPVRFISLPEMIVGEPVWDRHHDPYAQGWVDSLISKFGYMINCKYLIAPKHTHKRLESVYSPDDCPNLSILSIHEAFERDDDHDLVQLLNDEFLDNFMNYMHSFIDDDDRQKLSKIIQTMTPSAKQSFMAFYMPERKMLSDLSNKDLIDALGNAPASLLPWMGIDSKQLWIKDNFDLGPIVEKYLTVRDKLALDNAVNGELLSIPSMPSNRKNRVINLGKNDDEVLCSDVLSHELDQQCELSQNTIDQPVQSLSMSSLF